MRRNAAPVQLKHSLASASTIADFMVKKYVDRILLALHTKKEWKTKGCSPVFHSLSV